jgi:hypothetical protein
MTNKALRKIRVVGFVSRTKAYPGLHPEAWYACYENGSIAHYGDPLNADECRALVCDKTIRRQRVARLTGAVIYRLREVTP